jgi:hypothetical protein
MNETRNPFSAGIFILLALAAAFGAYRLLNNSSKMPRPPRRVRATVLAPAPALVAIETARPSVMNPPAAVKGAAEHVACTGEDAAVVWMRLAGAPVNRYTCSVVSDNGLPLECTGKIFPSGIVVVTIKRGYILRPKTIGLSVNRVIGSNWVQTQSLRIPGEKLPEPHVVLPPPTSSDPNVNASMSEVANALFVRVAAKDPKTQAIAVRPRKLTFTEVGNPAWTDLTQARPGIFEGEVVVPNPDSAREAELEIAEETIQSQSADITFSSAGLTPANSHRSMTFQPPEIHAGPMKSLFALTGIHADPPPKRPKPNYKGWLYASLDVQAPPIDVHSDQPKVPRISAVIISPTADSLGVRPTDYTLNLRTPRLPLLGKDVTASGKAEPGSLVIRATVSWSIPKSIRRTVVTVRGAKEPFHGVGLMGSG